MKEEQKQHLIDMMNADEELGLYEYIGVCEGNNGDGCFMDSSGHDCGCYTRVVKQEIKLDDIFNHEKRRVVRDLIDKQEGKWVINAPIEEVLDYMIELLKNK